MTITNYNLLLLILRKNCHNPLTGVPKGPLKMATLTCTMQELGKNTAGSIVELSIKTNGNSVVISDGHGQVSHILSLRSVV